LDSDWLAHIDVVTMVTHHEHYYS